VKSLKTVGKAVKRIKILITRTVPLGILSKLIENPSFQDPNKEIIFLVQSGFKNNPIIQPYKKYAIPDGMFDLSKITPDQINELIRENLDEVWIPIKDCQYHEYQSFIQLSYAVHCTKIYFVELKDNELLMHSAKESGNLEIKESMDTLFQKRYNLFVPPTHYYSPLPDIQKLLDTVPSWYKPGCFEGIDWNLDKQKSFLKKCGNYQKELSSLFSFNEITRNGYGAGYGEVEAHLLFGAIRHLKPKKVIEIGAGVSTYFTLSALKKNGQDSGIKGDMICVEPYPSDKIKDLAKKQDIRLEALEAEKLDPGFFNCLESGDILFIDTSHVLKVANDIAYIYSEILPRLAKGVIIHIHDIMFPYPTCPPFHPLFKLSLLWNESLLMKAFLMFNPCFEILCCQSYLHEYHPQVLKENLPVYDPQKHFPASLWIHRTKVWEK
jgi:hypothetical protein